MSFNNSHRHKHSYYYDRDKHDRYKDRQDRHDKQEHSKSLSFISSKSQIKNQISFNKFQVYTNMDNFETLNQVGEGTYGKVFKAQEKSTNSLVALKRLVLKDDEKGKEKHRDGFPLTSIREIEILQNTNHVNIIKLRSMISIADTLDPMLYFVFDYIDHDITGLLAHGGLKWEPKHIKCIAKQMFEGLLYLHDQDIMHRDLKGANLLLSKSGELKIADFGLARRLQLDKDSFNIVDNFEYTNRVVTLWYRSPELLFGSMHYDFAVDVWSAGCIFMELFTGSAIFPGKTEIDQPIEIFKICGIPTKEEWPEFFNLPWTQYLKFENMPRKLELEFAKYLSTKGLELISSLLKLNPTKRPSVKEILKHSYWREEPPPCRNEEIPQLQGDWHEYESKIRKKEERKNGIAPLVSSPSKLELGSSKSYLVDSSIENNSNTGLDDSIKIEVKEEKTMKSSASNLLAELAFLHQQQQQQQQHTSIESVSNYNKRSYSSYESDSHSDGLKQVKQESTSEYQDDLIKRKKHSKELRDSRDGWVPKDLVKARVEPRDVVGRDARDIWTAPSSSSTNNVDHSIDKHNDRYNDRDYNDRNYKERNDNERRYSYDRRDSSVVDDRHNRSSALDVRYNRSRDSSRDNQYGSKDRTWKRISTPRHRLFYNSFWSSK